MLKFHAKPGGLTAWPNSHFGGQTRRYVGREFVAADRAYPAKSEPDQIPDTDADAPHLLRKVSRGELWAADEHTARVAGVAFVALERGQDGEWFPKAKSEPKAKPSKD